MVNFQFYKFQLFLGTLHSFHVIYFIPELIRRTSYCCFVVTVISCYQPPITKTQKQFIKLQLSGVTKNRALLRISGFQDRPSCFCAESDSIAISQQYQKAKVHDFQIQNKIQNSEMTYMTPLLYGDKQEWKLHVHQHLSEQSWTSALD